MITWRRRGGDLPPEHVAQGGVLEIPRMREEYAGEYVCLVRNSAGQHESVIRLSVQGRLSFIITNIRINWYGC